MHAFIFRFSPHPILMSVMTQKHFFVTCLTSPDLNYPLSSFCLWYFPIWILSSLSTQFVLPLSFPLHTLNFSLQSQVESKFWTLQSPVCLLSSYSFVEHSRTEPFHPFYPLHSHCRLFECDKNIAWRVERSWLFAICLPLFSSDIFGCKNLFLGLWIEGGKHHRSHLLVVS